MSNLTCFCCGADITAPQFYKGRAYGYTCITKVSDQKRTKAGRLCYVACTVIPSPSKMDIIVDINGKRVTLDFPRFISESAVQFDGISGAVEGRTTKKNLTSPIGGVVCLDTIKRLYPKNISERVLGSINEARDNIK